MICPQCRAEYREGFATCADCGVALVVALPVVEAPDAAGWEVVFRSADPSLMPVIESALDAAGIPYTIDGEESSGLFPLGPFGGGILGGREGRSGLAGAVKVPPDRAGEARAILSDAALGEDLGFDEPEEPAS